MKISAAVSTVFVPLALALLSGCSQSGSPAGESAAPQIMSFTASPTDLTAGQTTTLAWRTNETETDLTLQSAALGTVYVGSSASYADRPVATTTYTLTATNGVNTVSSSVTVTVATAPAPEPGPEPTPNPAPTPNPTPDPEPTPDPNPTPDPIPPSPKALNVTVTGNGGVLSSPPGIDCGGDCDENYAAGSAVSLSATPDAGWAFAGWSGACSGTGGCTVTMSEARSVEATFTELAPSAPTQLSPADGAVFDHYPRSTTLAWEAVSGAVGYVVEVQFDGGGWTPLKLETLSATTYTFSFVGAQPGRWRVWAVGEDGSEGEKSGWRVFEYTI